MRASDREPGTPASSERTMVLVHGAGNTSDVWRSVQAHLRHPSLAVDLPGRHNRPADLPSVTIDDAARSVVADVQQQTTGRVVLVGHSAGGVVLPAIAARLSERVDHLVFVAGLCAVDGARVVDTVRPDGAEAMTARLAEMCEQYRGQMLQPDGTDHGYSAMDDTVAMGIDSLNFMSQTVSWAGVPPDLGRTFVRCLRDRIQPREMQAQLIENCGASSVIDIDCGHTPALAAPAELAVILDRILEPRSAEKLC